MLLRIYFPHLNTLKAPACRILLSLSSRSHTFLTLISYSPPSHFATSLSLCSDNYSPFFIITPCASSNLQQICAFRALERNLFDLFIWVLCPLTPLSHCKPRKNAVTLRMTQKRDCVDKSCCTEHLTQLIK